MKKPKRQESPYSSIKQLNDRAFDITQSAERNKPVKDLHAKPTYTGKVTYNGRQPLTFVDFYRMSANIFTYPTVLLVPQLLMLFVLAMTPMAFDFDEALQHYIPINWLSFILLVLVLYGFAIGFVLIKAITLQHHYKTLPFPLEGAAQLISENEGLRYFRRVKIEINLDEDAAQKKFSPAQIQELKQSMYVVIAGDAMCISLGKYIFKNLKWNNSESSASGFLNWEGCGRVINSLSKHIAPIQKQTGMIKGVAITYLRTDAEDYFEWTAEGD